MLNKYFVLHVFCVYVGIGLCQIDPSTIESATRGLVERFDKLKKYGLGVEGIEREYASVRFTYSHLSDSNIENAISQANAQQTIDSVATIFENIISDNTGGGGVYSDCCDMNRNVDQPCCYNCKDEDADLLSGAAAEIANSGIDGAEFSVGFANGSLLRYPLAVEQSCKDLDSRLMPWYVSATENSPREIVIFLDLNVVNGDFTSNLSRAAIDIINSLIGTDRVGLVVVTNLRQQSCGNSLATPTVKKELIRVIEETFVSDDGDYQSAFNTANGLFSNDISNQLFVLITDGRRQFSCDEIDCTSSRKHAVYFVNEPAMDILPHILDVSAESVDYIASYSSLFPNSGNDLSDKIMCTTYVNSNGVPSLSLSQLWQSNGEVVGVLNVLLPWNRLFNGVFDLLENRPSSYLFVLTKNSTILYHDSIPDMIPTDINLDKLEGVLPISDSLAMGNDIIYSTHKSYFLAENIPGSFSFLVQSIPVTYICSNFATLDTNTVECSELYACVVLADVDRRIITDIMDVDVQATYSNNNSRIPLYHTDADTRAICKEYCYESTRGRIGLQLTYPIPLPSNINSNVIDAIKAYIEGTGPAPSFIPSDVHISDMVAVASVVGVVWTASDEQSVVQRIPIDKRHFALPEGVYLSLPYVQLNHSFTPQYTNWYRSAMALEDLVTLSAADQTPTGRAVVYHASTTVKNEFGEPVGVVAAEVTEESLFVDVNNVLDGLCDRGYSCAVINSKGLFVLRPSPSSSFPSYIGQEMDYNRVFGLLLTNGVIMKRACDDLETDVSFNVFYEVKSELYDAECYSEDDCRHVCMQRINGTDSYLLVFKDTCSGFRFGLCNEVCSNCPDFNPTSPECQCRCLENRCADPLTSYAACSASFPPPHNYDVSGSVLTLPVIEFCSNRSECCSYQQDNCQSSPSCNWCSDENKCVPLGVCCDSTSRCCSQEPVTSLPECFQESCPIDQDICPVSSSVVTPTPTSTTRPINNTQAAIIGGVLGGLLALALVAILVVLCVWYQFFRAPDSIDDKAKGTYMFDDVRVASSNKTAIEMKENEANGIGNGN